MNCFLYFDIFWFILLSGRSLFIINEAFSAGTDTTIGLLSILDFGISLLLVKSAAHIASLAILLFASIDFNLSLSLFIIIFNPDCIDSTIVLIFFFLPLFTYILGWSHFRGLLNLCLLSSLRILSVVLPRCFAISILDFVR